MKHIVIVGKYYPPELGGIERYTRDVARVAAKAHRVTVVAHSSGRADKTEDDGRIAVVRCGTARIVSAQPLSPSMFRHLRVLRPDLLHVNAPNFWAAAVLSLVHRKVPLIITHHADVFGRPFLKRMVMPIYRHIARRATCVVVNSLKNAAISKDLPANQCTFVEIPSAIESGPYRLSDQDKAAAHLERRQRFGDGPVIGFVGRFVRYKALPVLVDALSKLDGVQAILIGDGPLRSTIEDRVRQAGLQDRVHFLGNLSESEKIRTMAMMDILTLPSNDNTEAFGLAQVEAQLMAIPVVATSLPTGVTDVTLHEITGLLVPPNDPDALAKAFARLIGDRELAQRLGSNGRERALRLFSMQAFEQHWSELFDAVLAGRTPPKRSYGTASKPVADN